MLKLKHKIISIFFSIMTLFGFSVHMTHNQINEEVKVEETHIRTERRSADIQNDGLHNLYKELGEDVESKVDAGILEQFHLKYAYVEYYQKQYYNFRQSESKLQYWANLSEEDVTFAMDMIASSQKDLVNVAKNLKMPMSNLERNQALGMYFDGQILYFLWTSEYLPIETYNLQSLTLNGITYNQQELTGLCECLNGDGLFETTFSYGIGSRNIQLNQTPIGGYHKCLEDNSIKEYGIGLKINEYNITGFTANLDPILEGVEIEGAEDILGTEYKITSNDVKTFKFSEKPLYEQNAMMQLSSHCYIEIEDIECQTTFGLNFGGYEHAVYFNTPLDLDDVYRVDVSYNLASDNKPWYNFIAAEGNMDVVKSLTPMTATGGFLGLSTYQGLTEGEFKSIEDDEKSYQYRLHLNYDADGWNLFKGGQDESKYTNVHDFKILRMNFLYKGQEIECEVKMDEIEGNTLSIFDKEAILNVESPIWEFKETIKDIENGSNNIIDGVTDFFEDIQNNDSKTKSALYIAIGSIGTILLGYTIAKIIIFIRKLINK